MKALGTLLIAFALLASTDSFAQGSRPYRDGPVTQVSFIRVKPGQFDTYMKYLGGPYRTQMEANQKAGLVIAWKVFAPVDVRSPQDPNVILTVTYPNLATLDKTDEFDAVLANIGTTIEAANKGFADRGTMREALGTQLMREVILK
jgi:hypothetical protein